MSLAFGLSDKSVEVYPNVSAGLFAAALVDEFAESFVSILHRRVISFTGWEMSKEIGAAPPLLSVWERSADEMGSKDVQKVPGVDDLCVLPERREVTHVAGDQVIGAGSVRALHEDAVVGIRGYLGQSRWRNDLRLILDELNQLLAEAPPNLEFGAREDERVFGQNGIGHVPAGWLGESGQYHGPLQAIRFERRRDDNVRINYQPKRDHRFFARRAALMTLSICCEVSLSVTFCLDSFPRICKTSGSGTASRT